MKTNRIHCQDTCTKRILKKVIKLRERKMMPERNLNLQKGIKRIIKDECLDKYKRLFLPLYFVEIHMTV